MSDCVFCDIVAGKQWAEVIADGSNGMAIVPLNPVVKGHVIVLAKEHVRDALDDPEVTGRVMRMTATMAKPPCNIITSVGVEATQTVMHLHVHIVPRREGDGLTLPWTGQQA